MMFGHGLGGKLEKFRPDESLPSTSEAQIVIFRFDLSSEMYFRFRLFISSPFSLADVTLWLKGSEC